MRIKVNKSSGNLRLADNDLEFVICEIYARLNKKKIIHSLEKNCGQDVSHIIEYLKTNPVNFFPYEFTKKYNAGDVETYRDLENGLQYVLDDNNRKIYLSRKYKLPFRARKYYNGIRLEQDIMSPHRYTTNDFKPEKNSIILDVGGAEGWFSMQYLDVAKKIYIFECDNRWIEALEHTFASFSDKVEIIGKKVSGHTDNDHISIDDFIRDNHLENEDIFIKIDAEGCEPEIIQGLEKTIDSETKLHLALCLYHSAEHEKIFSEIFKNHKTEISQGYMLYYYDFDIAEPYLRRGIMRVSTAFSNK
jgi:hypothetical protein